MRHLLMEESLVRESRDGNTHQSAPTKTTVVNDGALGQQLGHLRHYDPPPAKVVGRAVGLLQDGTGGRHHSPQLEVRVRRRGRQRTATGAGGGGGGGGTGGGGGGNRGRGAKPGATGSSTANRGRSPRHSNASTYGTTRVEHELATLRATSPSPERHQLPMHH